MFGQGISGTKVAFDVYGVHPFYHGQDNPRKYHLKRWTEENPNPYAAYPRLYSASSVHTTYNRNFSDYHCLTRTISVSRLCHWDIRYHLPQ